MMKVTLTSEEHAKSPTRKCKNENKFIGRVCECNDKAMIIYTIKDMANYSGYIVNELYTLSYSESNK